MIIKNILFFSLVLYKVFSFNINFFDPAIGNWKLLYCDNKLLNLEKNKCELSIFPDENISNKLGIKIRKYENFGFIIFTKIINSKAYYDSSTLIDKENIKDINNFNLIPVPSYCSLIILTAEKSISSIGIFDFPYFAIKYISGMNPKYLIKWRIDNSLNRLYIFLDSYTYVFEKKIIDIKKNNNYDNITTNTFLLTNLISFFLGKLLEKTIHIE
jgi:hypothetical protein